MDKITILSQWNIQIFDDYFYCIRVQFISLILTDAYITSFSRSKFMGLLAWPTVQREIAHGVWKGMVTAELRQLAMLWPQSRG